MSARLLIKGCHMCQAAGERSQASGTFIGLRHILLDAAASGQQPPQLTAFPVSCSKFQPGHSLCSRLLQSQLSQIGQLGGCQSSLQRTSTEAAAVEAAFTATLSVTALWPACQPVGADLL